MHRGPNAGYPQGPVSHPRYGPPGTAPPFTAAPFNNQNFPNLVSYPRPPPVHPPAFQNFSSEHHYQTLARPAQCPAGWTLHEDELQNLEVKKKAEEFLRILESKDRLNIPSESGEKSTRRTSADAEAERRSSEKHSRGQSRGKSRGKSLERSRGKSRARSRGKSRARSRGKSRARSRGKSRERSRGKSRARSRGKSRGRSRSRGKSCTRAKSQPRHRSRSRGRSFARSESQPRLHEESQVEVSPSVRGTVSDLFQNLKHVLQSRDLEKQLIVNLAEPQPEFSEAADFNPNSVLPHERVGGADRALPWISSWNVPGQKTEASTNKPVFSNVEDEEEFLYGDEDGRKKPQAVTVPLAQTRPAENPSTSPRLSKPAVLQENKVHATTSTPPGTRDMSAENCEKLKNLLNNIRLNLSPADINNLVARLKQKQEEQRGASSNASLRSTLDNALKHHKVQESDERRSHRSDSSRHKRIEEKEKEQREKQIHKKRKEYLVKELEGLLKHEGSGDLIPVIGFFCQRCEEFFGDLRSAEGHKHTSAPQVNALHANKLARITDRHLKDDGKKQQNLKPGERKRPREDPSPHRDDPVQSRVLDVKEEKDDDTRSSKKAKKKKKKEKKMKKEKKKEKKKKVGAEKD